MKLTRLTLPEYCHKYGVSVSTVRRRIKNGEVQAEFHSGKYFIKDEPLAYYQVHETKVVKKLAENLRQPLMLARKQLLFSSGAQDKQHFQNGASGEPLQVELFPREMRNTLPPQRLSPHKLLEELKLAYRRVLQEKEEQILMCKEEIANLQTLVRMLELENERLKATVSESEV